MKKYKIYEGDHSLIMEAENMIELINDYNGGHLITKIYEIIDWDEKVREHIDSVLPDEPPTVTDLEFEMIEKDLVLLLSRVEYINQDMIESDRARRMLFLIKETGFKLIKD